MSGLVEQLQSNALDQQVPVSTLLGKVKICAVKLGLDDALVWVDRELNGYFKVHEDEMPDYRKGWGSPLARDEYGHWLPAQISDPTANEAASHVAFREPVANYETLLLDGGSGHLQIDVDPEITRLIAETFRSPITGLRTAIARGSLHAIVNKVRNLSLDWALELSRAGITGEGLSFSANERERATVAHITIGTFNGSFNTGDASGEGAQISQQTHFSNDTAVIQELIAAITNGVSSASERKVMIEAAQEIAAAKDKPSLVKAYERLLGAAANHMTVLAPFLPQIGAMLAS